MAQYADTFNRQASSLGRTSQGDQAWRTLSGSWQTDGSKAYPSSTPAIAVLDTPNTDSAQAIDAYGGTALYARVKGSDDWIRARVNYSSYTQSSGYYRQRSGGGRQYRQTSSGFISGHTPPSNAYNLNYSSWYYDSPGYEYRDVSYVYDEYVDNSYTVYTWTPVLERSSGGSVTTLATGAQQTGRQSRLSLVVRGTSATMAHGSDTVSADVPADVSSAARAHGMGYGQSTYFDQTFDNYTLDTLNTPPGIASGLSFGASVIARESVNRVTYTFSDPDTGDAPSTTAWRWQTSPENATPGPWNNVTVPGATPAWDVPANTFPAGRIAVQALPTDQAGSPAPAYSDSLFINVASQPAPPDITEPTNNAPVPQRHLIKWVTPTQDAYEVRTVADNAGAPDPATVHTATGVIEDSTTRQRTVVHNVNGRTEHTQIRRRYQGLWSQWASVRNAVSFTPPPLLALTLTPDNIRGSSTEGTLLVAWASPAPTGSEPEPVTVDLYVNDGGREGMRRLAAGLPIGTGRASSKRHYTPAAQRDYDLGHVRLIVTGDNGVTRTITSAAPIVTPPTPAATP